MNLPTMGKMILPPPIKMPNKNRLWDRYAKGEVLKPTYSPIEIKSNVPPPPRPQEPIRVKQVCNIDLNKVIRTEPIKIKEGFEFKVSILKLVKFITFFTVCCVVGYALGRLLAIVIIFILQLFGIW